MRTDESDGLEQKQGNHAQTDSFPLRSLGSLLKKKYYTDDSILNYQSKPYRYFKFGWNQRYQYCYTDQELSILEKIRNKYHLIDNEKLPSHFGLKTENKFYDWWICHSPIDKALKQNLDSHTFTLPNREAYDAAVFPLWNFADSMARQIANWQAIRSKNQLAALMNDPTMLVLEELKNWFFDTLATLGTNKEDLEIISKRQTYIKSLIHTLPNFGADHFVLHQIQDSLEQALKIINHHNSNKKLPQLLTDILTKGKSFERTVGTYLHFMLTNEEVSDNYADSYLQGEGLYCNNSPVCKLQNAAKIDKSADLPISAAQLANLNKFYHYEITSEQDNLIHLKAILKKHLLAKIKFVSHADEKDKINYLESLALLESLTNIRKTLESLKQIQSSMGTHIFALNYLAAVDQLAKNYIELISKTQNIINDLLKKTNDGFAHLLKSNDKVRQENKNFLKNLQILETQVSPQTTINKQLEEACTKVIESVQLYQIAMGKIAHDMQDGHGSAEVMEAMRNLLQQMQNINALMPGIVNKQLITLEDKQALAPHSTIDIDTNVANEQLGRDKTLFDYGAFDSQTRTEPITKRPIYIFRVYKDDVEVGLLELFDKPIICISLDKKRHNIIKMRGVLSNYSVQDDTSITDICENLPPTLVDKIYYSATQGAMNGLFRGSGQVLALTLKSRGVKDFHAEISGGLLYYGALFTMTFSQYLQQKEKVEFSDYLDALYYSAFETGKIVICNFIFSQINQQLKKATQYLQDNNQTFLSYGLKTLGMIFKFGVFASSAAEVGVVECGSAMVAGATTEMLIESTGEYVINKLK